MTDKHPFTGYLLLSWPAWDRRQFLFEMKEQWGFDADEYASDHGNLLMLSDGTVAGTAVFSPKPMTGHTAANCARTNWMWPEAMSAALNHSAFVVFQSFRGENCDSVEAGKFLVKMIATACRQTNALGVCATGTVYRPETYMQYAEAMKDGSLPLLNLVFFTVLNDDGLVSAATHGMKAFGKEEMEVLRADARPSEVRDFLANIAYTLLENDSCLKDGDTVTFPDGSIHMVERCEDMVNEGFVLKINYEPENPA